MKNILIFSILFFFLTDISAAVKSKKVESIPFEMVGSYVVIRTKINDSSPLFLILDSGIRNTIITELGEGDKISLNYSDVKDLMGLGGGNHLEAYVSNFNTLGIGKLKLKPKTVYVLKEDVLNLSKFTGTKINGLIGIDFFQDYIVEVNYSKMRVNFYKKESFVYPQGYEMIPLSIEARKMFVELSVLDADSTRRNVKMLIDTGAELNAWFQTFKTESVHQPVKGIRSTIGQGLNGEITGKIARIPQICFGSFCLNNAIVSFPDSVSISEIVGNSDRDGTIGGQILRRFNYFIDLNSRLFYFKPNGNFRDRFRYNIPGIEVAQIIPILPQTEVWRVWENSPAAKAGVKVGDQILEVNGRKSFELNVNEIKSIFQTPSRYPLKLKIFRDNKEIDMEIDMQSQI